eukprot:8426412-Alexandrium_andersonii.AAC.1
MRKLQILGAFRFALPASPIPASCSSEVAGGLEANRVLSRGDRDLGALVRLAVTEPEVFRDILGDRHVVAHEAHLNDILKAWAT